MNFIDDLEQLPEQANPKQIKQELLSLSELLTLRLCRIVLLWSLFLLAIVTSVGQSHTPVSLYGLLCYFFVYLILSEYTQKYKTQEYILKSLCLRYHYSYSRLLTERFSFWFSFLLLAALQYAFLYSIEFDSILITYAPPVIALLLFLLRYLLPPVFRIFLKRKLTYSSCK